MTRRYLKKALHIEAEKLRLLGIAEPSRTILPDVVAYDNEMRQGDTFRASGPGAPQPYPSRLK